MPEVWLLSAAEGATADVYFAAGEDVVGSVKIAATDVYLDNNAMNAKPLGTCLLYTSPSPRD